MELIIKPTGRCNFNCKFCSASDITIQHPTDNHVPEQIKDLINKLNPNGLIITGGDPLMVDPEYYYELHELCNCSIGATTNLKDFYLNPDKWSPLFNEKWFNVTTSFNYGDSRMWDVNTVYDESVFLQVMDLYRERVHKNIPRFIAVIDDNNCDTVMKHVYLAKRLNTMVRLNGAIAVGKQSIGFPRYKMFRYYLDIIDQGLEDYEVNCRERYTDKCPKIISFTCGSTIRCCYVDTFNKLHISTCDEQLSLGGELSEDEYIPTSICNEELSVDEMIKPECIYCELYRLCNGCRTQRQEAKKEPDHYCEEMMKLKDDIIRTGWLI